MAILVLGGAGYIGSHMVQLLLEKDEEVVVLDNLQTGHRESLPQDVQFVEGDVRDKEMLAEVFRKYSIDCVIHFAASLLVPESIKDPLKYFNNNLCGMVYLLEVMNEFEIKNLVFSSSAAVYGLNEEATLTEDSGTNPISPYGLSKLMMEQVIEWCSKAYGINYVAFRYFNVAGASLDGKIGEAHKCETHLIPLVLNTALEKQDKIKVTGTDYKTKDGTNIRDYTHVLDLVEAHYLATQYLGRNGKSEIFNLGSESGYSVLEIIETARKVTGREIPSENAPRRGGDPDILIANSSRVKKILGWAPKHENVKDIIASAWKWHENHPNCYEDF